MAILRLKLDNDFIHLRIFDEKNECIAEVKGSIKDNKRLLGEIGKAYGYCFQELRDLIFYLERPKDLIDGLMMGYEYTKDRD
jgi:hypothetical protein